MTWQGPFSFSELAGYYLIDRVTGECGIHALPYLGFAVHVWIPTLTRGSEAFSSSSLPAPSIAASLVDLSMRATLDNAVYNHKALRSRETSYPGERFLSNQAGRAWSKRMLSWH